MRISSDESCEIGIEEGDSGAEQAHAAADHTFKHISNRAASPCGIPNPLG